MNKGRAIEELAVVFERDLPASSAKVWAFLTEPERLAGWYGEAMIEPREGGTITLMGGHVRGVITGWQPHQFLAHTWNVFAVGDTSPAAPITYLEFALTENGEAAHLVLTHRPIPARMQPQTMMGWHTFLDMLEAGLRGQAVQERDRYMQKNAALYGVDLNKLQR
jgi:uncharacterized protein YndB with AHSA1/START domain